jgi:hypothetical protein
MKIRFGRSPRFAPLPTGEVNKKKGQEKKKIGARMPPGAVYSAVV